MAAPTCSASLPARNGAAAPPEKRTNEYAAEATGRSTGDTFITASVMTVLTTPRIAPAATTATISTVWESMPRPSTSRSAATSTSAPASVRATPTRCAMRGAAKTDEIASIRPQPKNTRPSWCAPRPSGNGV